MGIGTTPTMAVNATTLAAGGASTATTSVAGLSGMAVTPPIVGGGLTGALPASSTLAPLLEQINVAIQAITQALNGGGLLGGGPGGTPGGMPGCDMPGMGGDLPLQTPPIPATDPTQGGGKGDDGGPGKGKGKGKGHDKHGDKSGTGKGHDGDTKATPPTTPAPPTGGTGGADGAPPAAPPKGGPTPAQTASMIERRTALQQERARISEQLSKYGGAAGTTAAVERIRVIDQELREIAAGLNGRAA